MREDDSICIQTRILGLIDGRSVNLSGTVRLRSGDTAEHLFRRADHELGLTRDKPFRRAFRQGIRPTILLNGERLEMPDGKDRVLHNGDQLSLLLAVGGG
jgi:molybdopterin converting factor small subunit